MSVRVCMCGCAHVCVCVHVCVYRVCEYGCVCGGVCIHMVGKWVTLPELPGQRHRGPVSNCLLPSVAREGSLPRAQREAQPAEWEHPGPAVPHVQEGSAHRPTWGPLGPRGMTGL